LVYQLLFHGSRRGAGVHGGGGVLLSADRSEKNAQGTAHGTQVAKDIFAFRGHAQDGRNFKADARSIRDGWHPTRERVVHGRRDPAFSFQQKDTLGTLLGENQVAHLVVDRFYRFQCAAVAE
jgi:hypothetical protein